MSRKSARVAKLAEEYGNEKLDPHYVGYFDLFNRGKFYEAHDILEHVWLPDRHGPNGAFHKGLIQLAGAFVHLQKNRLKPAAALFRLALVNLEKYPARHDYLDISAVKQLIQKWDGLLESTHFAENPLASNQAPKLALELPSRGDET